MRRLNLLRVEDSPCETIGVLLVDGETFCFTMENLWKDNKQNMSCIPNGVYNVTPYQSKRFGSTYIVNGVQERSGILFHTGNTAGDTSGCILLGHRVGRLSGKRAVLSSRDAMRDFLALLNGDYAILKVKSLRKHNENWEAWWA